MKAFTGRHKFKRRLHEILKYFDFALLYLNNVVQIHRVAEATRFGGLRSFLKINIAYHVERLLVPE